MTATHERYGHEAIGAIAYDEALRFGPEGQLVGIVSHPGPPAGGRPARAPAPAIVLLNAGVLHRVGPHRLHVKLARRLAMRGLPALRLDLGMIGDSAPCSDAATFRESAVADARAAMSGLADAIGARRFVLFGICSGADNALATALTDDRVAGVVLVDPAAYASRRGQLRELRDRVVELAARGGAREVARWGAGLAGRRARAVIDRLRRRAAGAAEEPPAEGREPPPIHVFREQLGTLAARGLPILAVYTGIHGPRYNHADQLYECFPELRGRVDRAYFPTANHTFTELDAQAQLLDTAVDWIAARFG